jgi:nucleoside 2-deoxyribosyltransferase
MKIYLAAPSECQDDMRHLRDVLVGLGHTITADWLDEDNLRGPLTYQMANRDIQNIHNSDAVIVYNPKEFHNAGTGGRHSELAFAIAANKMVILFGEPSQVFHEHLSVSRAKTIDDVVFVVTLMQSALNSARAFCLPSSSLS